MPTDPELARTALRALLDDRSISFKHRDALRAIDRALAVDMTNPANRKGELPQALGLVSQRLKRRASEAKCR
jgi:hypothetical protein